MPPLFSIKFQKITPDISKTDQQKISDLRFGGENQHVSQNSLNTERVGFSPLGDLTWNDPKTKVKLRTELKTIGLGTADINSVTTLPGQCPLSDKLSIIFEWRHAMRIRSHYL